MGSDEVIDRRFRLLAVSGQGAFGTIYRAIDTTTARDVALKVLRHEGTDFARFEREAEVLATVRHPNVVGYVAHGQTDVGAPYLAMDWLEGTDLALRLTGERLSVRDALIVTTRAAQGLGAAHALGVVHRDVKPSNIFLIGGRCEEVRIIDFGIARVPLPHQGLTTTGTVLGTPAYMSPEQARGTRDVSARADVFALGCVLFECLAGSPPFVGSNLHAVMANLLAGRTPRLSERRPDAPAVLDALLARMLAHDPADRFPDAAAVAIAVSGVLSDAPRPRSSPPLASRPPVTHRVLLVRPGAEGVPLSDGVLSLVVSFGADVRHAANDAVVAVFTAEAAVEATDRAVRCALAVRDVAPWSCLAVLTGRGDETVCDPATIEEQLGGPLRTFASGLIVIDDTTANHVSTRYKCFRVGGRTVLEARHGSTEAILIKIVGRARELATLEETFAEVVEEHCARVGLILGEPGIGKTRVLAELLARVGGRAGTTVLRAFCDRPTSTSSFAGIAQVVRERIMAIDPHASLTDRRGVHRVLLSHGLEARDADSLTSLLGAGGGELPPHVLVARRDPVVAADAFRVAWLAFVESALRDGPLLLAIDDLHFADLASALLLDAALGEFHDKPLLVVATARPDEASRVLPVFDARSPERVVLGPLRAHIAGELARAIMAEATPDAVARVVARAAGNPVRIAEFSRLLPGDPTPDSALGAIEMRLSRLDPFAARVLRLASVFGVRFPFEGVSGLLGDDRRDEVASKLRAAEHDRLVVRLAASAPRANDTWAFCHGLIREGAYATLAEDERRAAHAGIAVWLEGQRGADASLVAWHFERAEEHAIAFRWYEAAAIAALQGRELEGAQRLADEAMACGPVGDDRARVLVLRGEAALLLGNTAEGTQASTDAMSVATFGSATWVSAAALLVTAAGQAGRNDDVARLAKVLRTSAVDPSAAVPRALCLCRAATQLYSAGDRGTAQELLHEVEASGIDDLQVSAWVQRLRSAFFMARHDYEPSIAAQAEAARLHAACADVRGACLGRILLASLYIFIADFDSAELELDVAETMARRTGADYFLRWASYTRGKILALSADAHAARAHLEQARATLAGNPRMIAGTHVYAGLAALRAGDAPWAEQEGRAALSAHGAVSVQAVANAVLARALVRLGRTEEALAVAGTAAELLRSVGAVEENEAVIHLASVEALVGSGQADRAREAAAGALARLVAISAKLSKPARREAYLHGIEPHAETVRLAVRLGVRPPE
jgi:tetratricopeptide (TPR) repeat protein